MKQLLKYLQPIKAFFIRIVIKSAFKEVFDKATCIQHWHDAENDGMVVSSKHVRELWEVLEKYRDLRHSL